MDKQQTSWSGLKVGVGILVAVAIGAAGGTAIAAGPTLFSPAGVSPGDGVQSAPMPDPRYDSNESGLSFGSAADATSPQDEPDLIRVLATNGVEGYVYKTDLDDANGSTAAQSFTSPEEALAWQAENADTSTIVTVYAVDGVTVVGEFVVGGR